MTQRATTEKLRLGFLTTIETDDGGFVGGLLITNQHGRPLEFQCTTPVKPNRTQEILYGPTLVSYLLAEVIGQTLFERAQIKPDIILTSQSEILELRRHIKTPVAFCLGDESNSASGTTSELGGQQLCFHTDFPADDEILRQHANSIPENADLSEPFERVQEALSETIKTARAA